MSQTYAFIFCFALGIAARFIYLGATALAKRTNLLPVTRSEEQRLNSSHP